MKSTARREPQLRGRTPKAGLAARIQFGDDGPKVAQAIGGRDEDQDRDAETSNTTTCWRVTVGNAARK